MMSPPADHAVKTSVGVIAPGSTATFRSRATVSTSGTTHGVTRNSAPASSDPSASARFGTVPAPPTPSPAKRELTSRIAASASGTVIVISSVVMPPATSASATFTATADDAARMTGTIPPWRSIASTWGLDRRFGMGFRMRATGYGPQATDYGYGLRLRATGVPSRAEPCTYSRSGIWSPVWSPPDRRPGRTRLRDHPSTQVEQKDVS